MMRTALALPAREKHRFDGAGLIRSGGREDDDFSHGGGFLIVAREYEVAGLADHSGEAEDEFTIGSGGWAVFRLFGTAQRSPGTNLNILKAFDWLIGLNVPEHKDVGASGDGAVDGDGVTDELVAFRVAGAQGLEGEAGDGWPRISEADLDAGFAAEVLLELLHGGGGLLRKQWSCEQ